MYGGGGEGGARNAISLEIISEVLCIRFVDLGKDSALTHVSEIQRYWNDRYYHYYINQTQTTGPGQSLFISFSERLCRHGSNRLPPSIRTSRYAPCLTWTKGLGASHRSLLMTPSTTGNTLAKGIVTSWRLKAIEKQKNTKNKGNITQIHKILKRMLFIMTKHNMQIFRVSPFFKRHNNT